MANTGEKSHNWLVSRFLDYIILQFLKCVFINISELTALWPVHIASSTRAGRLIETLRTDFRTRGKIIQELPSSSARRKREKYKQPPRCAKTCQQTCAEQAARVARNVASLLHYWKIHPPVYFKARRLSPGCFRDWWLFLRYELWNHFIWPDKCCASLE